VADLGFFNGRGNAEGTTIEAPRGLGSGERAMQVLGVMPVILKN